MRQKPQIIHRDSQGIDMSETSQITAALSEIAAAPLSAPAAQTAAWSEVEEALGVALPGDFKAFSSRWGAVSVGDFLTLYTALPGFHPVITWPSAALGQARAYASLHAHGGDFHPLPAFPQTGSLLSFAVTDNGDYVGWIIKEGNPADWPIAVLDEESRQVETFEMGVAPFLLGVIAGEIRPRAFPDDLWDGGPLNARQLTPKQR